MDGCLFCSCGKVQFEAAFVVGCMLGMPTCFRGLLSTHAGLGVPFNVPVRPAADHHRQPKEVSGSGGSGTQQPCVGSSLPILIVEVPHPGGWWPQRTKPTHGGSACVHTPCRFVRVVSCAALLASSFGSYHKLHFFCIHLPQQRR